MSTIVTKDNKSGREIEVTAPAIFETETLADVVKIQGEDQTLNQVKAQLMVSFRAKIRNMLSATDDNGDASYSDDKILAEDFTDWKPEPRTRKSAEEKAEEALGALPPEVRAAVLAKFKANKKK